MQGCSEPRIAAAGAQGGAVMLRRKDEGDTRPAPHPHLHAQPGEMRSRTCGTRQLRSRQPEESPHESRSNDPNLVYQLVIINFES